MVENQAVVVMPAYPELLPPVHSYSSELEEVVSGETPQSPVNMRKKKLAYKKIRKKEKKEKKKKRKKEKRKTREKEKKEKKKKENNRKK